MMKSFSNIVVVGLGYVGLPTAASFARAGLNVLGVDISQHVVDTINDGRIHISEKDLDLLVHDMVTAGRLKASQTMGQGDAFVIAVPTPVNSDNSPNMTMVDSACANIAPVLKAGDLVIIESTSTVGTTERAAELLAALRPDLTFPNTNPDDAQIFMAYCPERVLPGETLRELVENARVLGGLNPQSAVRAKELYEHFVIGEMVLTHARAAEMSKLTENTFRDVNIAFANELSLICEKLDIDVWAVIRAANLHPRVNILQPGAGVGGHCIPVDPWFIIDQAPELANMMRTARETNHGKTRYVQKIIASAAASKSASIVLLGLAYKPDIDDMRESPSLEILEGLLAEGFTNIVVVEPNIEHLPTSFVDKPVRLEGLEAAIAQADVAAILVNHSAFKANHELIAKARTVIDPVGLLG